MDRADRPDARADADAAVRAEMEAAGEDLPADEALLARVTDIADRSVWFDSAHLQRHDPRAGSSTGAVAAWLARPDPLRRPPVPYFRRRWYLATNPDLWRVRDPYGHMLTRGIAEGRRPLPVVDRLLRYAEPGTRLVDLLERCPPALLAALDAKKADPLAARMNAPLYRARVGLPSDLPSVEALIHCAAGAHAGAWPPASFDGAHYAAAWDAAHPRRPLGPKTDRFLHWLAEGASHGVDPSPFFDADHYRAANPDLATWKGPLFEHYWRHGLSEERQAHPWVDPPWYAGRHPPPRGVPAVEALTARADPRHRTAPAMRPPLASDARDAPPHVHGPHAAQIHALARRRARLAAPEIAALVDEAAGLDPLVRHPGGPRDVRDPLRRMPGAQRVADLEALRAARGGRPSADLLLLSDPADAAARSAVDAVRAAMRRNGLPPALEVVCDAGGGTGEDALSLPEALPHAGAAERAVALLGLIRATGAARVTDFGTRAGWEVISTHGRALRHETDLRAWFPPRAEERDGPAVWALRGGIDALRDAYADPADVPALRARLGPKVVAFEPDVQVPSWATVVR
ncbi:hypothetical protein JQC91_06010 [Jannaschia sp. Os4]|uniref:hypothetical protein n=1 Tax=Jannaschia sp. Os4 TaxID=2807617 RepID=UPI00193A2EF8|nr:hypothetical protein [Jannaschia sp. Os4]MBM2575852.1 hypothetical protein [Jannaschia sp. Os4]